MAARLATGHATELLASSSRPAPTAKRPRPDAEETSSAPDGLTAEERACFVRDGFVVLRGVVPPQECTRLLWDAVAPALARVGIDPFAPDTWDGGDGDTVRAPNGGDHPIPLTSVDSRWPALFESPRLRGALDALHGGTGRWQWRCW